MNELEVFFCDLCNTSVPAQDLDAGSAKRVQDKVVGSCCLRGLGPSPGAAAASGSSSSASHSSAGSGSSWAGFVVLLVGVAAGTLFLDWRLGEESIRVGERIDRLAGSVKPLEDQLDRLREQADENLGADALSAVEGRLDDLGGVLQQTEGRVLESVRGGADRVRDLGAQIASLDGGQRDHLARIVELQGEVRKIQDRLETVVAEAAARPAVDPASMWNSAVGLGGGRTEGAAGSEDGSVSSSSKPSAAKGAGTAEALPDGLQRYVDQLADTDDGARFEAVDELLQSGDARVCVHIIPLIRDADPFVRRLVCEGLRDHPSREAVDALLTGLDDAESLVRYTAHASLKTVTQQDFPFDPHASSSKRMKMKQRWVAWWDKNAADLF